MAKGIFKVIIIYFYPKISFRKFSDLQKKFIKSKMNYCHLFLSDLAKTIYEKQIWQSINISFIWVRDV